MPSRAVVKKKLRREAKRSKSISESSVNKEIPHEESESLLALPSDSLPCHASLTTEDRSKATTSSRKRSRCDDETDEIPTTHLSRKERHRLETARRLQREMDRLEAQQQRAKLAHGTTPNETVSIDGKDPVNEEKSKQEQDVVPLRHDPRFINGTFWRDRKEKRARTVFCGGLPVKNFSKSKIEDLLCSTLRKDHNAAEYLGALDPDASPIASVDYLPLKHDAKVRNMYVTLASVPLAGCLIACLDGKEFNGRRLRCNFAADKAQRAEAIKRRSR